MKKKLTFEDICHIEPSLKSLYEEALTIPRRRGGVNNQWYSEFKPYIENLVGWEARHEELRTMEAYDTAYDTIYNALCQKRSK